jgi:hypothetical protein
MTAMDDGLWLYAVTGELEPARVSGLRGVADAAVGTVEAGGLTAVFSPVSLEEFGADALARNLEDLDWLVATARAHDAVIGAVARAATAIPLRLASIYHDEDGVRALLAGRAGRFRELLDQLGGRTEWGVKAYADPPTERGAPAARSPARRDGGSVSGTAYLLRRKEQVSERERIRQRVSARTERLHAELAGLAVAACRHRPQDKKLSGNPGWMVLNGAYLVDDARSAEFVAAVDTVRANTPEFRLELTGPWPPYSFASLEPA